MTLQGFRIELMKKCGELAQLYENKRGFSTELMMTNYGELGE